MKKVYVTDFDRASYKPKQLFPLVRPFLKPKPDQEKELEISGFAELNILTVDNVKDADFVLVSEPLTHKYDKNKLNKLNEINKACAEKGIQAYVYISGDYGKVYPKFSNVTYHRLGGFKTQLDQKNKAIFPLLSDKLNRFFGQQTIFLRSKKDKPVVGFCGHASNSTAKYVYEKLKMLEVNGRRFLAGDLYFEPLFSSTIERYKILQSLSRSENLKTNFIFRERYRAGAATSEDKTRTTLEYYQNIVDSDYIFCLRGGGNFSVRLYETLMMGRIPVFVNTDCLLPLEDEINWQSHVVWVEWKDRRKIAEIISNFHKKCSEEEFIDIQNRNRELWLSHFTVKHYLEKIVESC